MSIEKAKACLSALGYADHIIELAASTATVSEAAQALGVQPGMIAKTMSFLQDDQPILILTEGRATKPCSFSPKARQKSITASIRIRFAPKPR